MRPTYRLSAALQVLQHDHTSPGHRVSRSAIVMLTGMTSRATLHVHQSSRRTAHHAVQVICRPATAPRAARPSCRPTHGRTRAWLDIYVYSDDFASQKRLPAQHGNTWPGHPWVHPSQNGQAVFRRMKAAHTLPPWRQNVKSKPPPLGERHRSPQLNHI